MKSALHGLQTRDASLLLGLTVFLVTQYWHAFAMPFVGDDFVILERVGNAGFRDLWRRDVEMLFGWYRPISRELHYWVLQGLAETHAGPFHIVSFALWIGVLFAFYRYLDGLAGSRAAAIAVSGAACLSAWGGPLMWVAGVQDLWMLFFGLLYLLTIRARRPWLGGLFLALALLSKESAVVFLPLALTTSIIVDRLRPAQLLRLHAPAVMALLGWALLHPTLLVRLSGQFPATLDSMRRPPTISILGSSALAALDLELWPRPEGGWGQALLYALLGCAALLVGLRPALRHPTAPPGPAGRRSVLWTCGLWIVLGALPALTPSIGWHAYYAIIMLLGIWAALGLLLADRPGMAVAVVVLMTVLRAARADTPSWDWGTEWYQRRAGDFLHVFRAELQRQHPEFPPHSRVYLTHVPNNIGIVAGRSPTLRIWYGDSTLQLAFLRDYRARAASERAGRDYFFWKPNDESNSWWPASPAVARIDAVCALTIPPGALPREFT